MSSEKHVYIPLHEEDNERPEHSAEDLRIIKLWRTRCFVLAGLFLASLCIIASFLVREHKLWNTQPVYIERTNVQEPYSPAADQVEYVNKWLSHDPETHRFMGKPRPEVDEAWHDLLEGTLIRITDEELALADNATSIRHKDGGFVAGLGVSHSLHCLKRIKQYMHPDYYYKSPGQNWEELEFHADHCLESLRQSILCQADLSVYTLEWTPHSRYKPAVRVPQPHTCVDWDRIHEWMIGRQAKNDEMEQPPPEMFETSSSSA